ncbi:hypothetical protein SARC_14873 [Sphaeroforma arctica JP610]|uniref:Uncharacterized protein n=1 Tax=Sphaeroforma arctica JP610 TaxID=667725 RepID=A0A0L0F7F3_9EUKA|nr:hypothetical protein SARC_14873 [Sphaeroforma arctica JP610]KNC72569.1 hypothetical protein SARC_14873 [Sphaeroforma arctica JP610]|eukprot:XP_014146471.1 hypothetical protein SARC_14873 [Sphaeroforma arctica JP610]
MANKQDLPGAVDDEQIKEILRLKDIKSHHWHIEACSAVTGEALQDGMQWIVRDIQSRVYLLD